MTMIRHDDHIDQLDALLEDAALARGVETLPALSVLVAVADDAQRESVLALATALHRRRRMTPSLLHTLEIAPVAMPDAMLGYGSLAVELDEPKMRAWTEARLRGALHLDTGVAAAWPMRVKLGPVVPTIADEVEETGAGLVIMGMHRHTALGRALGNDTLHGVIARNIAPVLAVRSELEDLPRKVIVAVDFSAASRRAAHLARRIMDEHGTLYLVNVSPDGDGDHAERTEGARLIHARGLKTAFAELVEELDTPPGMTVATVSCRGETLEELTVFAAGINADLIAVGRQRHSVAERLRNGSVTNALAADGRWSLLVIPQGSHEAL